MEKNKPFEVLEQALGYQIPKFKGFPINNSKYRLIDQ
jgi:hypothetical protein